MTSLFNEEFIAAALGAELVSCSGPTTEFIGVAIDSRQAKPGDLFVALPGVRTDGHLFIDSALTRGASGVICQHDHEFLSPRSGTLIVRVTDCLRALRLLAAAWRCRLSCPVIAVAGSVGKTTTKEMIAAMLRGRFEKVYATERSENGDLGIPLTILRTPIGADALVVEVGIDRPGAMAEHMQMVRPILGIVTAVAPEHLEALGSIQTVADEENQCLKWLAENGGKLALSLDDPNVWSVAAATQKAPGRCLGYSMISGGAHGLDLYLQGTAVDSVLIIEGAGIPRLSLPNAVPGLHNMRNLLGAVAVARLAGLTPEEMTRGLVGFATPWGRSEVKKLPSGCLVLCDYYNASPASMNAAFHTASSLKADVGGRLLACLGDMLELGAEEERYHRELADELTDLGFQAVLTTGTRMSWLNDELGSRGYLGDFEHFPDATTLAARLASSLHATDVLLIKGSRGVAMEQVWDYLLLPTGNTQTPDQ